MYNFLSVALSWFMFPKLKETQYNRAIVSCANALPSLLICKEIFGYQIQYLAFAYLRYDVP